MRDVDRTGLHEPDVAVDPGTFVEPPFVLGGVSAHHEHVSAAPGHQVGDVGMERCVPAEVASDEMTVQCDGRVTEHAVEFQRDPATLVAGWEREDPPVPSDAGRGIVAPQRMIAKVIEFLRLDVRQFDRPIVRQVHRAPTAVVEVPPRGPEKLA